MRSRSSPRLERCVLAAAVPPQPLYVSFVIQIRLAENFEIWAPPSCISSGRLCQFVLDAEVPLPSDADQYQHVREFSEVRFGCHPTIFVQRSMELVPVYRLFLILPKIMSALQYTFQRCSLLNHLPRRGYIPLSRNPASLGSWKRASTPLFASLPCRSGVHLKYRVSSSSRSIYSSRGHFHPASFTHGVTGAVQDKGVLAPKCPSGSFLPILVASVTGSLPLSHFSGQVITCHVRYQ